MGRTFGRGTRYDARFRKDERVVRLYTATKDTKNGEFTYLRGAFVVDGKVVSIRISKATAAALDKAGERGKDRFGGHFTHWARVKASPSRARRYAARAPRAYARGVTARGGYAAGGYTRAGGGYTRRAPARRPASGARRYTSRRRFR